MNLQHCGKLFSSDKKLILRAFRSSELLQTLICADLVDEYRLAVFPVVLGEGKRLFEQGVPPRGLTLVETRSTPMGVIVNTYRPAGLLTQYAVHANSRFVNWSEVFLNQFNKYKRRFQNGP